MPGIGPESVACKASALLLYYLCVRTTPLAFCCLFFVVVLAQQLKPFLMRKILFCNSFATGSVIKILCLFLPSLP